MKLRMLVDTLFYLFQLNHRLVDTDEVLGLGDQVLGLGLGGQVLGLGLVILALGLDSKSDIYCVYDASHRPYTYINVHISLQK